MNYKAEIITIGTELLKGATLNTNAKFLGRELTDLGFEVQAQTSCQDRTPDIHHALRQALSRSDLIVLSGGLGPTPDDITRDALASFFRVPLVFSAKQYAGITRYYRKHGYSVPSQVRREALYPGNAVPVVNKFGIALGFYIKWRGRLLVILPGVAKELENMFHARVQNVIKRNYRKLVKKPCLTAKIAGLSEPSIITRLKKDFFSYPFEFGIYPEPGEVTVRISADSSRIINVLRRKIKSRLNKHIYAYSDDSLSSAIGDILVSKSENISIAESCTGGLCAYEIAKAPGASRYFKGAIIAYGNQVKEDVLGVSRAVILKKGAVSKKAAQAMAKGVRALLKTDYGIGITGIAGPAGGSKKKPVGLVYIGLQTPKRSKAWRHVFWGDRAQIQIKAAKKALEYLWREIR